MTDECSDNANYKIADESEAGPTNDFSGEPPGNETDHQYDQQTLI
jgi:hypothetical protein